MAGVRNYWVGRGAGREWRSAGRGMRHAKDGQDGYPEKRVLAQRTNRKMKFVPKYAKRSASSSWIFKDRFTNARLRKAVQGDKPWSLTEEEFRAIKNSELKPAMRERRITSKVLMRNLREEEMAKMQATSPRHVDRFKAGDKLLVTKALTLDEGSRFELLRGTCLGKTSKLNDSTFTVLNHKNDTTWEMKVPFWSPFLKKVEVLQKGKIKRRKAVYLRHRPVEEFQC